MEYDNNDTATTRDSFRIKLSGARFSLTDGVAIVVAVVAFFLCRPLLAEWTWFIPLVVIHFFLFCNIFRVRTRYELAWCAVLLINFGYWLNRWMSGETDGDINPFPFVAFLCWQLLMTLLVILLELSSDRYHGIFADQINPKLDKYVAEIERKIG